MPGSCSQGLLKSDLIHRLALNLDTAEEFGPITELWANGRTHQILGLSCGGGGLLGRQGQRFLWSQVGGLGRDGVVLKAGVRPEEVDRHLQDCLPLGVVEIWSDHGDRVGQLIDYRFDRVSGNMVEYLFTPTDGSGLPPGVYALPPIAVISTGRRRMMAEAAALQSAVQVSAEPPVSDSSPRSPFDRLPLDRLPLDRVPDPRQGWQAVADSTRQAQQQVSDRLQSQRQKLGAEAQDRRQKLQAEAQDKLSGLLGNVKKRTRHLRHQLREAVTDATAGLPSGQDLRHHDIPTIDVDAMELWPEDDFPAENRPDRR